MVDVAAIFDEVFGPEDRSKGLPKNGCARCVGVLAGHNPLENIDNPGTPAGNKRHTAKQGVLNESTRCARDIVKKQHVTGKDTPAHRAHLISDTPLQPIDLDAFSERAGIIHEAHTRSIVDPGTQLPEPTFTLTREEAETLAAQEQGHADADGLHGAVDERWVAEIDRLVRMRAVSPDGATALKSARAFISEGWALQAARLGWDEVLLFGVCPRKPWARLDRKGVAFGGAVQAVTQDAVAYVGGLRRYRAQVNNDNGAVPIWELARGNPSNGGDAA
jgi:hypothetical protein